MENAQRLLLAVFALFAVLTIILQLQYGSICGHSESANQQEDPKARACRKRAGISATLAAVSLAVCIVLGVLNRY